MDSSDKSHVSPDCSDTGAHKKPHIITEPFDVVTTDEPNLERNIDLTKRREPAAVPPGAIVVVYNSIIFEGMPGPFHPSFLREEAFRFSCKEIIPYFGKAIKTMRDGKTEKFHIMRKDACGFFGYPVILPEGTINAICVNEFFDIAAGCQCEHEGEGDLRGNSKGRLKLFAPFYSPSDRDNEIELLRFHLELAVVYIHNGNPELAFKECQEVFRNEPQNVEAILYAARACILMGDLKAAGRLLQKGIALKPDCEAYQTELETLNIKLKEKLAKEEKALTEK